uniref:Ig-like domain-containing protein n=1 Tax=Sarcophilus harrisii TaxID=9305 RepID=G3VVQ6_SARHA
MSTGFLYFVTCCFLWTVPLDAGVTQIPRNVITRTGQNAKLRCKQNLGHNTMFWYRQDSKMGLQMMFYYNNKQLIENATVSYRFSPDSSENSLLDLYITSLKPEDTAMYLCASSQ